jgi:endonuclease G
MRLSVAQPLLSATLFGVALLLTGCAPEKPNPVPRQANAPCSDLTVGGFPLLTPALKQPYFICRKGAYALEFNAASKTALWAVERLESPALTARTSPVVSDFRPEPGVPEGMRSELLDYAKPPYIKAQMVPADDFPADAVKTSWSFYLSATLPMNPDAQRGIWVRLERNVRDWALQRGQVFVVTGPIYLNGGAQAWVGGPPPRNSAIQRKYSATQVDAHAEKMAVPTHFYKVVYDARRQEAIAFIIPNQPVAEGQLPYFTATVTQVEQLTHLTFFPNWPARTAAVGAVNPARWPLR